MQVWVIVSGLAFLMVLGSILWIMPSKRDRRIARLRQAAILKGIKVKLIKYPVINLSGRVEEGVQDSAAYSFHGVEDDAIHAGWMLIPSFYSSSEESSSSAFDGWGWYIQQGKLSEELMRHLQQFLEDNKDRVHAISIMGGGITIGWNENGSEADLDDFESWVRKLRELLKPYLLSISEDGEE